MNCSDSDSDEDCYGNLAQKLAALKNKLKIDRSEFVFVSEVEKPRPTTNKPKLVIDDINTTEKIVEDNEKSLNDSEISLDSIIASNSKRRTRSQQKAKDSSDVIETNSNKKKKDSTNRGRGRGRGKGRGKSIQSTQTKEQTNTQNERTTPGVILPPQSPQNSRRRRRNRIADFLIPELSNIPTYSVGNTEEYYDQSDHQQLFSTTSSEVVTVEEDDPLNENEELSVKVYWQNSEFFKFIIRRYQKIVPIFEFFSKKENISHNNLLFTYNERILKADDTPDSIDYRIVKFIDGGIVNQNVTKLVTKDSKRVKNGILLKFQCQNIKKPFEVTVMYSDSLSIAMMQCAEHFETPIDKMKFYFDGDLIIGKMTPKDLELEGGECIDVKIVS